MSGFRYQAARPDGAIVRGTVQAVTAGEASTAVTALGLFPIALEHAESAEGTRRAASRRDLAIVFQSISALASAGVPLERAIAASESLARGALRETLALTRSGLREGHSFSQALARERGVVPGVVLGMIHAGERGSQLAPALQQVATHLEQEAELVARVQQALAYPALLALAGVVSVFVIGTTVVPRFAELLGDFGQELPVATRVLIIGSRVLERSWPALAPLAALVAWLGVEGVHRPVTRRWLDETLLALPIVGRVRQALATARVTRALGGMLRAGMPLLPALEAAREAAGDFVVAERLDSARERVAQGAPLAPSLERERALSTSALQLVAVGESSARLGEMALRAGDLAAQEAERGLRTLVTLLEPALIVSFGGLVAFVALALLQAVYSIRPGVF
ncbi:MAG TPA: type II secretion system F family protein [Gemmatimonadales bacterium]|nr:type II secretion system F family protein [Gemmatimonadales bacterium]